MTRVLVGATIGMLLAIVMDTQGEEQMPVPAPTNDLAALVTGINEFALTLHRRLAEKDETNFVLSPFSVSTALAIIHAGARGETATEMGKVLHFTLPADQQAQAFKQLLAETVGRAGEEKRPGELTVANGLWVQKGMPLRDDFLKQVRDNYRCEFGPRLDLRFPDANQNTSNRWIETKTRDKVRELLQPGDAEGSVATASYAGCAVYLNKSWTTRFDKIDKQAGFQVGDKKTSAATMRARASVFSHYSGDGVQLLQLPYDDGRLAMLILLPDEPRKLAQLEQELAWSKLKAWIGQVKAGDVEVILPRVKLETRNYLRLPLAKMGSWREFSDLADFSGMFSAPPPVIQNIPRAPLIKDVLQQTFFSLDEHGTEAATATAVRVLAEPLPPSAGILESLPPVPPPPPPKVTFRADRPFLIFVRDTRTGAILFTGRVMDPSQ